MPRDLDTCPAEAVAIAVTYASAPEAAVAEIAGRLAQVEASFVLLFVPHRMDRAGLAADLFPDCPPSTLCTEDVRRQAR